jgi:hypothetical protein
LIMVSMIEMQNMASSKLVTAFKCINPHFCDHRNP